MNVIIDRRKLLSAVKAAEKVAPSRSPVAELECIQLCAADDTLTVMATDLEIGLVQRVPAKVRAPGTVLIAAKWLSRILSGVDGQDVTLCQEETGRVRISCGSSQFFIVAVSPEKYPSVDQSMVDPMAELTDLPAIAKRTVFAASDDVTRPELKCVNMVFTRNGLRVFGCDGRRVAAVKNTGKSKANTNLLLPALSFRKLAQMVGPKEVLQVAVKGKRILFAKDDFLFSARLMEGRYLDVEQILSSLSRQFSVLSDAVQLREALASVGAVSGQQNRLSITYGGNVLELRQESELGSSAVSLPATALSGSPDGTYWYTPDALRECLRALDGTVILDVVQHGALLLRTDQMDYMQTAVREPKPIEQKQKKKKQPKKAA